MDRGVEHVMAICFRIGQRLLPIPLLKVAILPVAMITGRRMVLRDFSFRLMERLPPAMKPPRYGWRWRAAARVRQLALFTTRFLCYSPEKLRRPRWRRRCLILGLRRLTAPLAEGRPVVLATLHCGDLVMLYHWLRSRGIPVTFLATRKQKAPPRFRARLDGLADRVNGLEDVPRLMHHDQLWDIREYLTGPRVLAVAMERDSRRSVSASGPGYSLRLSPGALRLAGLAGAVVVPCVISSQRWLSSTVFLGRPVPPQYVRDCDYRAACDHIVQQLIPRITGRLEQCSGGLIELLEQPVAPQEDICRAESSAGCL